MHKICGKCSGPVLAHARWHLTATQKSELEDCLLHPRVKRGHEAPPLAKSLRQRLSAAVITPAEVACVSNI